MIPAPKRLGISAKQYDAERAAGRKWCWFHGRWEPREGFSVDRARSDGLCAVCKLGHAELHQAKLLTRERRMR